MVPSAAAAPACGFPASGSPPSPRAVMCDLGTDGQEVGVRDEEP